MYYNIGSTTIALTEKLLITLVLVIRLPLLIGKGSNLDEGFQGLNKSIGRPNNMSENNNKKDALNLAKSEKEELIKLREENEFLKASLTYELDI